MPIEAPVTHDQAPALELASMSPIDRVLTKILAKTGPVAEGQQESHAILENPNDPFQFVRISNFGEGIVDFEDGQEIRVKAQIQEQTMARVVDLDGELQNIFPEDRIVENKIYRFVSQDGQDFVETISIFQPTVEDVDVIEEAMEMNQESLENGFVVLNGQEVEELEAYIDSLQANPELEEGSTQTDQATQDEFALAA